MLNKKSLTFGFRYIFLFSFLLLVLIGKAETAKAYSVDGQGRALVTNKKDIADAISILNGGAATQAKPAITSTPPELVFQNDIYCTNANQTDGKLQITKAGTASSPFEVVINGNGNRYTYGTDSSNNGNSLGGTGAYQTITFKNMNIGNLDRTSPIGTEDASKIIRGVNANAPSLTGEYYGIYYVSSKNGITVKLENVNYVAGKWGQLLYCSGTGNKLLLSGNNNIIYPKGAKEAQELLEGPVGIELTDGTTNILIENNNDSHSIINSSYSSSNPAFIKVPAGARLNLTDSGGTNGGLFVGGLLAPLEINVGGEFNIDSTGSSRNFTTTTFSSIQLNVAKNAKFTSKGNWNWNLFTYSSSGKCTITAEEGSYIDFSRGNGRIFSGTPNATNSKIILNNPRYAAFRSSTNNSVFGSSYKNLKIQCAQGMAAYAYSVTAPIDDDVEMNEDQFAASEAQLSGLVRAVDTSTVTDADFATVNTLFPNATTIKSFKESKAIVFKNQSVWWIEKPSNTLYYNYGLNEIYQAVGEGDFLASRNDPVEANNIIKINVRDDRSVSNGSFQISCTQTDMVNAKGKTIQPLVMKELDGSVKALNSWVLTRTSSGVSVGKFNTDSTISFDKNHGVLANVNIQMGAGEFKGVVDWTIVESI
ncbi:MAG: hypothetical protein LBD38_00690 [Streptococcaceae bacterium]|jgi:hypothetical protein|nr:hypothetical protein [Streptococcaceae bacterium]